jgi:hypothetical protein
MTIWVCRSLFFLRRLRGKARARALALPLGVILFVNAASIVATSEAVPHWAEISTLSLIGLGLVAVWLQLQLENRRFVIRLLENIHRFTENTDSNAPPKIR